RLGGGPEPERGRGTKRGWVTGRRSRAALAGPGTRWSAIRIPRIPDARRPDDHAVEHAGWPANVEAGVQRIRLAQLSGRALRNRRRAAGRGARQARRAGGPTAD